MERDEIQEYYDDTLESKTISYRVYGNRRIDRAVNRVQEFMAPDSRVLNVGCGVGMVAERLASQLDGGYVWAFDLSERHVRYARETVDRKNIEFFAADLMDDRDREEIRSRVSGTIDVVTLIDVIEHVPREHHEGLFEFFASLANGQQYAVMTYPSPQFQRFLEEERPENLQIVDQTIHLEELLDASEPAGFSLRHYSLETVWKRNQYVHCVLQTDDALSPASPDDSPRSLPRRLASWVRSKWKYYVLVPYRRWKYVDGILKD